MWRRFPVGSVPLRAAHDVLPGNPWNAWGVYSAAWLARALGHKGITVLECGVVTGDGLVGMEQAAALIADHFQLEIDVVGIDSGEGLPEPVDYRDGAHIWDKGFYVMDAASVRARLRSAELIVGPLRESLEALLARPGLKPLGYVCINLDYYSLAREAFRQFAALPAERRLPRVYCFLDDVMWPERACHNEWMGELLMIREFNEEHQMQKVAKLPHLSWMRFHPTFWNDMIYILHQFDHPLYTRLITPQGNQYRQM